MRFRRPQPSELEDEAVNLSGWLYADLLLGLAVVFLGAAFIFVKVVDDQPATATPTTTTTTMMKQLRRELRHVRWPPEARSANGHDGKRFH